MNNVIDGTKGYKMITGTSLVNLAATPLAGFTTQMATVIAAITHPSGAGPMAYNGDAANLVGISLPAGLTLPIRATSITLTSGALIGWLA